MEKFYEITRVVKTYINADCEIEALEKFEDEDFVFEDMGIPKVVEISEEEFMLKMMGDM